MHIYLIQLVNQGSNFRWLLRWMKGIIAISIQFNSSRIQARGLQGPDGIFLEGPGPAVGKQGNANEEVFLDSKIWLGNNNLKQMQKL